MFSKRSVLLIIAIFIVSFMFLSGCSQSNERKATADKKNQLILAIASEPEGGFDPTTGWGRYGSPLFQSTLLKRDNTLKIINDLATGYKVSDNGLEWTVSIRKDVKFSDGKPLTAADVKYTFETAAKDASVVDLTNLKVVDVVDEYTVRFILNTSQSTFADVLVGTGIVPKHAHNKDYAQNPIGSGPFKLVQWDKGQQLIVEPNPNYYGSKPQFEKITFLFLSEDATLAAAKAGKLDIAVVPPAMSKQNIQGMHLVAVDSVDNRGIEFPYVRSGNKSEKGFPVGNDVTSDIAIRKAINVAINRKALVDGVLEGQGTPAYTVCDALPWWNPETIIKDNDMNEAKRILTDAGWKDTDGDGILDKGSLKAEFTLIYPSTDKTRQSLAIAVMDMIKPLGINIKAVGKSWDEIYKSPHSDAIMYGWGSHSPLEMYNLFKSTKAGVESYNAGFYNNPAVDQYMDKAMTATNEQEAMEYWKRAQWDGNTGLSAKGDAPWAWLVNLKHCYFVKDTLDVGNPKIEPHGHGWPITDNIVEWHRK